VNGNDTGKKLSTAQYRAIASLLTKGAPTIAALDAGISRSTLYRWQHEPLFVAALRDAEQEAVEGLARSLAGLGDSAADTLRDALSPAQKITVRLRAAEVVINNLLRLRELVTLEARIEALEKHSDG
jgi:hypothetical protein